MPSLRLFIAIETPPDIIRQITAIRDRLRTSNAHVKWEPEDKLHVTLKFIGNADENLLPQIVSYSRGVALSYDHLLLKYKGAGCFPNTHAPKVFWIGLEDAKGNLGSLQEAIESCLVPLGIRREERKFHGHVTIGRVWGNEMVWNLLRMMESITFESQPVEIRDVALIRSVLKPGGSVYTTLEKIPLGG